ncbi:MAG: carboxypeptidase regulatory-like domain-containing protein [Deltaproteobacteria bacterium]|nr:carboxypeptidase regulatory-like domain-containing protein [Deltaproteobacteria bacterium]
MTRRARLVLSGVLLIAVIALGLGTGSVAIPGRPDSSHPGLAAPSSARTIDPAFGAAMARGGRSGRLPFSGVVDDPDRDVTISGTIVDARTGAPVPSVEVVFRNETGEETVMAGADGRYKIAIARGRYHAFVRDESVLSVGRADNSRLPSLPSAEVAGVPDEGLMPIVVAARDAEAVDLSVMRGGTIIGQVVDLRGAPIAGAVVRARGGQLRPTLGTDVAETDAAGRFELYLPAGGYALEATHERYAGVADASTRINLGAGARQSSTLTLTAGCVIAGRVTDARGNPSGDGAIEKRWGTTDLEFGPTGRVESDGTFRWVTTEETDVTLRAWPWKSPPSESRTFSCRDGARFTNVVFQLQNRTPDIEGTLVDENGAPVPFAFVDFAPQSPGGIGQQERTDAEGRWQVFSMPAGQYRISASAAGHGVTVATVSAPARDVALQLGGVGRIEGTTTLLANGTFELTDVTCADAQRGRGGIRLAQQHRLVQVTAGHFTIDDLPACNVWARATWRDQNVRLDVEVPANGTATVELELGPPRAKTVRGTVRDEDGRPIPDALVTAAYKADRNALTRTDGTGRYSLQTFSGATINVEAQGSSGMASVGQANVDDEQVDVTLGSN